MEWLTHRRELRQAEITSHHHFGLAQYFEGKCAAQDETIKMLLAQTCYLNSQLSDDTLREAGEAVNEYATQAHKNDFNKLHYLAEMGKFTPALLAEVRRLKAIVDA